jgi:transcriptional regulator with XRE-family HTH domain
LVVSPDAERALWCEGLAERLKLARRLAGLSQAQVGARLGIPRVSVGACERGEREVRAWEVLVLAELYRVAAPWLLGVGDFWTLRVEDAELWRAAQVLGDADRDTLVSFARFLLAGPGPR